MQNDEDSLGLSFLMNAKKRTPSDVLSISSGRSSLADRRNYAKSDAGSVRSIKIEPSYIDVNEHISKQPFNYRDSAPKSASQSEEESIEEDEEDEYTEEEDDKSSRGYDRRSSRNTEEDILNAKKEMLYQFERMEKKGMRLPKKFTLASSLEEMKMEFQRLKRDREVDSSIKFQRRMTMSVVSGAEFITTKFNVGVKLQGWSEKVYDDIDDYDDIFEELHEKYKDKAKMSPELKLLASLGGSAFMFHMTNRYMNTLPGLDQVLKNNPELARQLADATNQVHHQQQQTSGNFFGNLFGSFFGGGGGSSGEQPKEEYQAPPQQKPPQPSRTTNVKMQGPSNIEDILAELEKNNNERIEVMSAISASDMSEMTLDDVESSINGLILGKKKKRGLTLDL